LSYIPILKFRLIKSFYTAARTIYDHRNTCQAIVNKGFSS